MLIKNLCLLYTLLLISQLNAQEYFNQIYETEGRARPGEAQITSGSDSTQEAIEASIYNLQGQIVHTEKIPAGQNTLSLIGIPQGVYIVHLKNKKGQRQTERIILQY